MQTHKQVRRILAKCSEGTFCVESVVAKLVFAAPVKRDGKRTMASSMISPSMIASSGARQQQGKEQLGDKKYVTIEF